MKKILTLTILIFCLFSTSIKAENTNLDFNNIKVTKENYMYTGEIKNRKIYALIDKDTAIYTFDFKDSFIGNKKNIKNLTKIKVKDKIENKIKTTKQNENKDYSTKFLIINIGAFGVTIFSILNLIKNEKNKINKKEPN